MSEPVSVDTAARGRTVAVLGFHKIGYPPNGWDTWFYIATPIFMEHLRCLQSEGWEVIDFEAFLRGLADPEVLPPRSVLLTFDDGYRSNLEIALPCLEKFHYPSVMFVPTEFIGGFNRFDKDNEPEEAICGWGELRRLRDAGVSVQSHGVSHRGFSQLSPADIESELEVSKAVLEDALGRSVELFSYPYGDRGLDPQAVDQMMHRIGYKAAFLYGGGLAQLPADNQFSLTRVAMGPDTDLAEALRIAVSSK